MSVPGLGVRVVLVWLETGTLAQAVTAVVLARAS